jgi:hypothetical protein
VFLCGPIIEKIIQVTTAPPVPLLYIGLGRSIKEVKSHTCVLESHCSIMQGGRMTGDDV